MLTDIKIIRAYILKKYYEAFPEDKTNYEREYTESELVMEYVLRVQFWDTIWNNKYIKKDILDKLINDELNNLLARAENNYKIGQKVIFYVALLGIAKISNVEYV